MQDYFFILNEQEYKYYSQHYHSELFKDFLKWYESYKEAKEEIDKLRKLHPDVKFKIYVLYTTITEMDE
jgi:hypothetical protein